MSRFFKSREEDSSSGEEEEYYSSEEYSSSYEESSYDGQEETEFEKDTEESASVSGSEDEEGETTGPDTEKYGEIVKKVSKSYKQKYEEDLRSSTNRMNASLETNSWIDVLKEFDNLVRLQTVGTRDYEGIPRHMARVISKLYDVHNEANQDKEGIKKFNPSTAKAFSVIKQKLKRSESIFEDAIKEWKKNPISEEQSTTEREELERQKELLKEQDSGDGISEDLSDKADKRAKRARRRELSAARKSQQQLKEEEEGYTPDISLDYQKKRVFEPKPEDMLKHLERISQERGKKSADKLFHVQQLEVLLNMAMKPEDKCKILSIIIPARIDLSSASKSVNIQYWTMLVNELSELMDFLWENDDIRALLTSAKEKVVTAYDSFSNEKVVYCNITTYIKGIYKEFIRSLQDIDPKTGEYINRMKDEYILYTLAVRVQKYFEKKGDTDQAIYAGLRRLKHIYYRQYDVIKIFEDKMREARPELEKYLEPSDKIVEILSRMLSKSSNELIKTHSFLVYVYNLALNDKHHEARDLILMSHLQNNIHKADVSTQILYNRVIVQLGLCAFRNAAIKAAVTNLHEVIYSGHTRELLAQGAPPQKYFARYKNKTESQRTLPYFMHINVELIECVYLTCSMLLEVPSMVLNSHDPVRRMFSRQFCRMIDYNERQPFTGPPENVRDHITAASFALATGDWKKCRDYIHSIKLWDLMPNPSAIKDMITLKIREEAVKTFMYTYSLGYKSILIDYLVNYFELPSPKIRTIVSKMINSDEIDAFIDDKTEAIIFGQGSKQETTRLQQLAILFSSKLSSTVENNEKIMEGLGLNSGSHSGRDLHDGVVTSYSGGHPNAGGHHRRDRDNRGGGQKQNTYSRYANRDHHNRSRR